MYKFGYRNESPLTAQNPLENRIQTEGILKEPVVVKDRPLKCCQIVQDDEDSIPLEGLSFFDLYGTIVGIEVQLP